VETAVEWLRAEWDGTLQSVLFAIFKFAPWLAVATHLVRHLPSEGEQSDKSGGPQSEVPPVDWSPGFRARALQEVHAILTEAPAQWRADPLRATFAEAVTRAVSSNATAGEDPSASSRRFVQALVRVWTMQKGGAMELALQVANSVLADGRRVGELLNAETPDADALVIASGLRHVNELWPLPRRTIAGVAHALGLKRGGDAFLAASARLGRELMDVLEFLNLVCDPDDGFDPAPPSGYDLLAATSNATRIASLALQELCAGGRIPPEFPLMQKRATDGDAAWLAFVLAVASFVVPGFVSSSRDQRDFCLDAALAGELSPTSRRGMLHFFSTDTLPGVTPCRNFFIRCLVSKVDEQGLSALAGELPALVGHWVTPYLQHQIDSGLLALLAVPQFREQNDQCGNQWVEALPRALGGVPGTGSMEVLSSRTPSAM
jgi:hypothetical protein